MRFLLLVTCILKLTSLYSDTPLYGFLGYREVTAFRKYIYTISLDPEYFKTTTPGIGSVVPTEDAFNFLLFLNSDFRYIEVSKRDESFIESLEFPLLSISNKKLISYNSFSHSPTNMDTYIHHSMLFLREGIYSYGFLTTVNFSPYDPMGNKNLIFSSLDLYNFQLVNMFEFKRLYITPNNRNQDDNTRLSTKLLLNRQGYLIPELYQLVVLANDVTDITHRLKTDLLLNDIKLYTKVQHRKKRLTEYQYSIGLQYQRDIWEIDTEGSVKYINTPILKNSSSITYSLPFDWKIHVKNTWERIISDSNTTSIQLLREGTNHNFQLKYSYEITYNSSEWNLNGSISSKVD